MAAILNVGNIDLQKKGEFLMPDVLDIWNRFFHTRYLCSHFFSQVFECINPNNKELAFVLSVSIPYKRKLFMIKSSKRKDLTHF